MHLLLYEYCAVQSAADPVGLALLNEGWGMLRALVEDLSLAGHCLTVIASPALELGLRAWPGVKFVPTLPEADLDHLACWATRTDAVLVIAPEFRGLLVERVRLVREVGGRSLNCDPESLTVLADKYATCAVLPCPPTVRWTPDLNWQQFPAVVKPVDGAGSQGVRRVDSVVALRQAVREVQAEGWTDLIVQPYFAGLAASVCLLTGTYPQVCPPTEQVLSRDGQMHYLGARYPLAAEVELRVQTLLGHLDASGEGLRGWLGVDLCLSPEGTDFIFDVNPRLTTSYLALRQRCRGNLADAMVRIALGESIPPLEWDATPLDYRVDG